MHLHCGCNELQKQDEMEDSEYTNFPVHVLTKNQKREHKKKNFIYNIYLKHVFEVLSNHDKPMFNVQRSERTETCHKQYK